MIKQLTKHFADNSPGEYAVHLSTLLRSWSSCQRITCQRTGLSAKCP